MKKIGILALQGAFIEHAQIIEKLNHIPVELRSKADICSLDGIILPGGESTVQGKLLHELDMFDAVKDVIVQNTPVLATCAGLILLAREISNDSNVYFGTLPITVRRNAYGRQLGSFTAKGNFAEMKDVDMTFIRAPYIEKISDGVEVLSMIDNNIVAVKYKKQLGLSFHPELDHSTRIHEYFLSL